MITIRAIFINFISGPISFGSLERRCHLILPDQIFNKHNTEFTQSCLLSMRSVFLVAKCKTTEIYHLG